MQLTTGQRIGVIASAIWAVTAYLASTRLDEYTAARQVEITRTLCSNLQASRNNPDLSLCKAEEVRTWNNWTSGSVLKGLAIGFLPIPFGWVFSDLIIWLLGRRAAPQPEEKIAARE